MRRPALHARQAAQSLHLVHQPHVDDRNRARRDGADYRALGHERLRARAARANSRLRLARDDRGIRPRAGRLGIARRRRGGAPRGGGSRSVRGIAGDVDPCGAGPGGSDPRCPAGARAGGVGGRAVPGRGHAGEPCPGDVQHADRARPRAAARRHGGHCGDARRPPGADHPGGGVAPVAPLHRHRNLRGRPCAVRHVARGDSHRGRAAPVPARAEGSADFA